MMVGAVIPAAGRGLRFGGSENKVWSCIAGRPILAWTLDAIAAHADIGAIVVVAAPHELAHAERLVGAMPKVHATVAGGVNRSESVRNGIDALPDGCDMVLVHDAARPCVTSEVIDRVIDGVIRFGAAVPGLNVTDTVKSVDSGGAVTGTVPREILRTVQTPQGAWREQLVAAYAADSSDVAACTDEAALLAAAGIPVRVVAGDERNLKVTLPDDLAAAAAILAPDGAISDVRTGIGYDVHPFADNRDLWLCGVRIRHSRGLAGHSDADVALHSACDALLGAAGLGDIGLLFPDTDLAHKDRPSIEFLVEVQARVRALRWHINNVDICIVAECPRIGPYRGQMQQTIADALQIDVERVGVKATTNERMGFVGRREGIACMATAALTRRQ